MVVSYNPFWLTNDKTWKWKEMIMFLYKNFKFIKISWNLQMLENSNIINQWSDKCKIFELTCKFISILLLRGTVMIGSLLIWFSAVFITLVCILFVIFLVCIFADDYFYTFFLMKYFLVDFFSWCRRWSR